MAQDETEIDLQQAAKGQAQWVTAATNLDGGWRAAMNRIQTLNAGKPWGNDQVGQKIEEGYFKEGGPEKLRTDGDAVVEDIVDLGPKIRTAIENSLNADQFSALIFDRIQGEI